MADGSDLEFQKQHQVSLTAPSVEDVNTIIKQVLDENIGNASYPHKEAVEINQRCVETITKKLVMLNRPYKYIVNSALLQTANSTGLNVSTISYWNKQTDMSYSYRWDSRHMLAIVYVFAVALGPEWLAAEEKCREQPQQLTSHRMTAQQEETNENGKRE